MKHADSLPLVMPPRRRGWIDIVMLRPLGTSPHTALVMTRRGQLVGVVPAGSTRVLSDYLDWPCEIIEVDGRERRLALSMQLESRDSGRFFQTELQLIYQVLQPERIALEVDDALGEFEKLIQSTLSSAAHMLSLDQEAVLKESVSELFQRGGTLPNRAIALGLTLKRVDVSVEPNEADRLYMEKLKDLQRERPLMWRFYCESLDPQTSFEIQVGAFYKARRHLLPSATGSGIDEIEFALRNAMERAIRRVAIEFAPQEYREAARAMSEALVLSPVLLAELAAAEVDLLRPAVEIQPARPMLVDSMRARLALPAPAEDAGTGLFDRMLPPPAIPQEDPIAPLITPPADGIALAADPEADLNTGLWEDDEQTVPPLFAPYATEPPAEAEGMPTWLVDRAIFGAKQPDIEREEHIPEWLRGWDQTDPILTPAYAGTFTPGDETANDPANAEPMVALERGSDRPIAAAGPAPAAPTIAPRIIIPASQQSMPDEAEESELPAPTSVEPSTASHAAVLESQQTTPDEIAPPEHGSRASAEPLVPESAQLIPDEVQAPELTTHDSLEPTVASRALIPAHVPNWAAAADISGQVARWMRLLRSDGDEEFEHWATILIEQPNRLPIILSGLIRDPQTLAHSTDPSYQAALADELSSIVVIPSPPAWLAEEIAQPPGTDLPDWMRLR